MAKTNLFAAAKAKGATASNKPQKEEVVIKDPQFHLNLSRLAEVNQEMDALSAEANVLAATVKERSIKEFTKLYDTSGKYPGSFNLRATGVKGQPDASLMFIPTDKYIKIGEERYNELTETYGEGIATEKTTYIMDAGLVEKYAEELSDAISKIKAIPEDDKKKLIQAVVSYEIAKGTISELPSYPATITEMLEEIKPVYQMKNVKIEEEE
jgi:hypothetical protein